MTVGTRPPIRIAFEIILALELKGLSVNIEDATVRAIRIGSCGAKTGIKCEKVTLIERSTKELDLPAVSPCRTHGIPIAPPRTASVHNSDDDGRRSRFTVVPRMRAMDAEPLSALPI